MQRSEFQTKILSIQSKSDFERIALEVFRYQAANCKVYSAFIKALNIGENSIEHIEDIPFLPIEFFKTAKVITGEFEGEIIFTSSGTTGANTSKHFVRETAWYERIFLRGFELFYGSPCNYSLMALLPSYLERNGSSLIMMAEKLIDKTKESNSGFFLNEYSLLSERIKENESLKKKTLLLGVTFALLNFAEQFPMELHHTIIMETGGMKGMREELTRQEVSDILKQAFSLLEIHSEYGMTELMSQAYSLGDGIFRCPPWMKTLIRETNDPLSCSLWGRGVLNIIDLANLDSCAFIATQDVGEVFEDYSFSVLGRMDRSDSRGCNLLVV